MTPIIDQAMIFFGSAISCYKFSSRCLYDLCYTIASLVYGFFGYLELLKLLCVVCADSIDRRWTAEVASLFFIYLFLSLIHLLFVALVTALTPLVAHPLDLSFTLS